MESVVAAFKDLSVSLGISENGIILSNFVPALLVLLIGIIAVKIIMKIISKAIDRLNVEKTLHTFLKSVIRFVLYFILTISFLGMIGIPITSLIALLSVAGLAFSLAIQGSLSNLASGVSILFTKPFKVGDFIEANGVSGTVKDIGLFYTSLLTADKKGIFIPNSKISDDTVTNYNAESERKLTLKFTASYDDDIEKVKKALRQAVDSDNRVLKTPEPLINVSNYLDSSIEYIVAVWVKTEDYWNVNWYLLEEVKRSFDENGVTMSYNHLNVHIVNN